MILETYSHFLITGSIISVFLWIVSVVGLRVPLFWKDSEHFSTKGSEYILFVTVFSFLFFLFFECYYKYISSVISVMHTLNLNNRIFPNYA